MSEWPQPQHRLELCSKEFQHDLNYFEASVLGEVCSFLTGGKPEAHVTGTSFHSGECNRLRLYWAPLKKSDRLEQICG